MDLTALLEIEKLYVDGEEVEESTLEFYKSIARIYGYFYKGRKRNKRDLKKFFQEVFLRGGFKQPRPPADSFYNLIEYHLQGSITPGNHIYEVETKAIPKLTLARKWLLRKENDRGGSDKKRLLDWFAREYHKGRERAILVKCGALKDDDLGDEKVSWVLESKEFWISYRFRTNAKATLARHIWKFKDGRVFRSQIHQMNQEDDFDKNEDGAPYQLIPHETSTVVLFSFVLADRSVATYELFYPTIEKARKLPFDFVKGFYTLHHRGRGKDTKIYHNKSLEYLVPDEFAFQYPTKPKVKDLTLWEDIDPATAFGTRTVKVKYNARKLIKMQLDKEEYSVPTDSYKKDPIAQMFSIILHTPIRMKISGISRVTDYFKFHQIYNRTLHLSAPVTDIKTEMVTEYYTILRLCIDEFKKHDFLVYNRFQETLVELVKEDHPNVNGLDEVVVDSLLKSQNILKRIEERQELAWDLIEQELNTCRYHVCLYPFNFLNHKTELSKKDGETPIQKLFSGVLFEVMFQASRGRRVLFLTDLERDRFPKNFQSFAMMGDSQKWTNIRFEPFDKFQECPDKIKKILSENQLEYNYEFFGDDGLHIYEGQGLGKNEHRHTWEKNIHSYLKIEFDKGIT